MSRVDGHGLGANDLVEMAQINRASCGKWRGLRTRTSGHQIRNGEIRRDRYVEEVEDMGTDRAAGRHSSTMRRAIGARTPSVEVPPLGCVHQYAQRQRTTLQTAEINREGRTGVEGPFEGP